MFLLFPFVRVSEPHYCEMSAGIAHSLTSLIAGVVRRQLHAANHNPNERCAFLDCDPVSIVVVVAELCRDKTVRISKLQQGGYL